MRDRAMIANANKHSINPALTSILLSDRMPSALANRRPGTDVPGLQFLLHGNPKQLTGKSPRELQSKLHDPSAVPSSLTAAVAAGGAVITEAIRAGNLAEARAPDSGIRNVEVRSIRRVEHLPSELEAILILIEWEVLDNRYIQVFL